MKWRETYVTGCNDATANLNLDSKLKVHVIFAFFHHKYFVATQTV